MKIHHACAIVTTCITALLLILSDGHIGSIPPVFAAAHGSATPIPPLNPPLIPLDIANGGSWNGVAGSGGLPPSVDPTQFGAQTVTNALDNTGSGTGHPTRLTVGSTATFFEGQQLVVSGIVGTTEANNQWLAHIVDPTHVDLCTALGPCTSVSNFSHTYVSGGVIGSVQDVIASTDCYNYQVFESLGHCTIAGATSDRFQTTKVVCYLEGNTLTINTQTQNPDTGSFGYVIPLAATALQNGDANLYCDIYPVNGYVRRVGGSVGIPIWLDTSAGEAGYVNRSADYNGSTGARIYVAGPSDSPAGVDTGNCTNIGVLVGTSAHPLASLRNAISCAPNGGVVVVPSGETFVEDNKTCVSSCNAQRTLTTNPSPRLIDVRPSVPATPYNIVRTSRVAVVTTGVSVTNASPGVIFQPAHGLQHGSVVVLSAGSGVLATGMGAGTYYVKTVVDANHYTVATQQNASAVNTTSTGTGFTVTSGPTNNQMNLWAAFVNFNYADFDLANIGAFAGAINTQALDTTNHLNGTLVFTNSSLVDSNGASGGPYGYYENYVSNSPMLDTTGVLNVTVNSTIVWQASTAWQLALNATETISWDAQFLGPTSLNNQRDFNRNVVQTVPFHERFSIQPLIIVASATYHATAGGTCSDSNTTELTFSGSPTINAHSSLGSNVYADWYPAGGGGPTIIPLASHVETTSTTVCLSGNYSATGATPINIGDSVSPYQWSHVDCWQPGTIPVTSPTSENQYHQRYRCAGVDSQPIFIVKEQPAFIGGVTPTFTGTIGPASTAFTATGAGASSLVVGMQIASGTGVTTGTKILTGSFSGGTFTGTVNNSQTVGPENMTAAALVTTAGYAATFNAPTQLQVGDFIYITNGAGINQSRRCVAIPDSTHCTLATPFYADIGTAATWNQAKNMKDVACVACVLQVNTGNDPTFGALGQLDTPMQNWAFLQLTFIGTQMDFRVISPVEFGIESYFIGDSIFSEAGSSVSGGSMNVESANAAQFAGASFDNNQFYSGTYIGTSNGLQQNFTVNSTTYKPTSGLTKAMLGNPATGFPMFLWNYDGTSIGAISGNPVIGAQQP